MGCEFRLKVGGGIATFMEGLRWLKLDVLGGFEWKVLGSVSRPELVRSKELEG